MKRFTASEKWEKQWFQDADPKAKLFWLYLMDKADACGVWEINLRLAGFQIGAEITTADLEAFGERLELLKDNKVWIRSFCRFQYGALSEKSPPHKNVISLLKKHGLSARDEVIYADGTPTLALPQESPSPRAQEKEKDKDKDKGKEEAKEILRYLNEKTGHDYQYTPSISRLIKARLKDKGVTVEGVIEMIDAKIKEWTGTDMAKYLRPATLFAESKFSNYYGARKKKRTGQAGSVDATGRKVKKFQ